MLPILKRGGVHGPIVSDLQVMLNLSKKKNNDSKLDDLDPDGKFGPKTEERVREYQKPRGLSVDGRVGPLTRGFLFADAYAVVSFAQDVAVGWVLIARATVRQLLAQLPQGNTGPAPTFDLINRLALKTHFHIDLTPTNAAAADTRDQLEEIADVYDRVLNVLQRASIEREVIFKRVGRFESDVDLLETPHTDPFAYNKRSEGVVKFAPGFTGDLDPDGTIGPLRNKRVNTMLHECAHFADNDIHDFAYELPAPQGRPGKDGTKLYTQLDTDEAMANAACYATFAQNVVFRTDVRFSDTTDDLQALCGTASVRP